MFQPWNDLTEREIEENENIEKNSETDETICNFSKNKTSYYETVSSDDESEVEIHERAPRNSEETRNADSGCSVAEDTGPRKSARILKPIIRENFVTYLTVEKSPTDPWTVEEAL